GFWTQEHLETGYHVFPFRVEELRLYGENPAPGVQVECRARISLVGDSQTCSDIDLVGPSGCLLAQLRGWEDRRFDLPVRFRRLWNSPRTISLSEPWPTPLRACPLPESVACRHLEGLAPEFLEAHGRIWRNVLAHLTLSDRERHDLRTLPG